MYSRNKTSKAFSSVKSMEMGVLAICKSKAINEANREDLEYWRGVLNTATQVFEHTEKYLQSEENNCIID